MFRFFLTILLFLSSFVLIAQKQTIDSLYRIVQSSILPDTIKIDAHNELAWELRKNDFLNSKKHASEAYTLSKKINYSKGIITSLNRLGTVYLFEKDFSESEKIYLKVLKLETDAKDSYGIGRAHNQLSEIYRNKKNLDKAMFHSNEAFKNFQKLNLPSLVGLTSNNLGLIYQETGSYELAMKFLLMSVSIREELKEEINLGYSYMNLGILFLVMKNYDSAKNYFLKSKKIFLASSDDYELAKIYNNLGIVYFETGDIKLAKQYYNKSIEIKNKLNIADNDSDIYNNLGTLYHQEGNYEKAIQNFQKSLDVQNKYVSQDMLKDATVNFGHLYLQNKEYDKAILYYQQTLKTAQKSKNKIDILNSYYNLYTSYSYTTQYDSLRYYINNYNALRKDIDTDYKKAVDLKQSYEEKRRENEVLSIENQKKNILLYTLSIISILAILLLFLFFRWKGEKQKAKLTLIDKQLEEKRYEELIKNQELKSINDMIKVQDLERKRISQDLHDRLGSMLSVAKVYYKIGEEQLLNNEHFDFKQFQKANTLLDDACQEVRKISYEMSSGVLTKFGLLTAIADLVVIIEQTKKIDVEFITSDIENRLDSDVEIQIYRIIQELLNNLLKHSEAKNVTVQILKLPLILNVQVEDDGKGFDTKKLSKGLGLHNIESRVQSLGGSIQIDSVLGRGTAVNIEIPIN